MTHFDDELAALLALDALERDEQADAELRMGTFPADLTQTSAALAEQAAMTPPDDLRASALERALGRRAPGRPVDAAPPCSAADAYRRTADDLHELLLALTPDDWDRTAHDDHGRVRDLVAHLIGVERLSVRWLDPDDDVPLLLDHVESTRSVVDSLADADPHELAAQWFDAARAVIEAAATGDPDRRVSFHDLTSSIDGFLVTRTFELWAHSMDIASAIGGPLPELDPERMALLSSRLMAVVPLALAYRRATLPGRTARFVLTGRSGGCYTVALDPHDTPAEPDVLIVADTVQLCRLAASRLTTAELGAHVTGDADLAERILTQLDAFARD